MSQQPAGFFQSQNFSIESGQYFQSTVLAKYLKQPSQMHRSHLLLSASFKETSYLQLQNSNDHLDGYLRTFKPLKVTNFREISNSERQCLKTFPSLKQGCPWFSEISPKLVKNPQISLDSIDHFDMKTLFEVNLVAPQKKQTENNKSKDKILKLWHQKPDMHLEMLKHFEISMVLKNNTINSCVGELINKKFILFLKGNYKQLKFFDEQEFSQMSQDVLGNTLSLIQTQTSIPFQQCEKISIRKPCLSTASSLSISEVTQAINQNSKLQINNFLTSESDFRLKNTYNENLNSIQEQKLTNSSRKQSGKEKRKQIFHNLSKYLMHLILEMLSSDHLASFQITPGYETIIKQVVKRLRETGKRNKLSQTFYFNHSHYNCFFLTITEENKPKLKALPEFLKIQQEVFGEVDFNHDRSVLNLNIVKMTIGRIVKMQIAHILEQIDSHFHEDFFDLSNIKSDCQAKIYYLRCVYRGIDKLLQGNYLIRF